MTSTSGDYYIGIDVGTGSVRASLVKKDGAVAASATQEIKTWRDPSDHRIFEQSTADIWTSTAAVIKSCLSGGGVSPTSVKGIGFDATCSLAVTDFNGDPLVVTKGASIGLSGERNVILWADHRAEKETELINKTRSIVLDYVGGTMSVRAFSEFCLPIAEEFTAIIGICSWRWRSRKYFGSKTTWIPANSAAASSSTCLIG